LLHERAELPSQKDAVIRIARLLTDMKCPHRRVSASHRARGPKLKHHCLIDASVLDELNAAVAFAPLHMPAALAVIRFAEAHFPDCRSCVFRHELSRTHAGHRARVAIPTRCERKGQALRVSCLSCESIVRQLEVRCRGTCSSLISAMAQALPREGR